MTITRLGIFRDAVPLSAQESAARGADEDNYGNYHYNESTGMEYQIHEVPEGVFFEAWHEDVGLVTWYSADTIQEVWAEIEADEDGVSPCEWGHTERPCAHDEMAAER